jgi:hypothetical protein
VGATSWSKEAVEPRSEVGDECEHRLTNVTFVARTSRLEPFAPVVAPQFLQKAEQTTAEMRFLHRRQSSSFSSARVALRRSVYIDYYHRTRTHLSLDKDSRDSRPIQPPKIGRVVAIRKSVACITATNVSPTDSYQLLLTVAAEYWRRGVIAGLTEV